MNDPTQPPKPGMSTLTKVLIGGGIALVLVLGTCGAGAVWLGHKAKEVKESIADGGLVLVAPPEVVAALAGPKKDYIGTWTSESGKSSLAIQADGAMKWDQDERGTKETITAPIAAFTGNDIELHFGLIVKIEVSEPPHQTGGRWEMTARKIRFHRE